MTTRLARTVATAATATTLVLGLGACTQVSGNASKSSTTDAPASTSASSPTSESSSETAPSESSESASSESSSSESSSEESTAADSGSGPKPGKVGDEVKTDQISVKVTKITDPIKAESDYDTPDKGKRFVALNVSITNIGADEMSASRSCIKVKLDDNTMVRDDWVKYGQGLEYGTLYKGDTTTGDVVYQVPDGKKIKTIDIKCGYGDERAVRITAN